MMLPRRSASEREEKPGHTNKELLQLTELNEFAEGRITQEDNFFSSTPRKLQRCVKKSNKRENSRRVSL